MPRNEPNMVAVNLQLFTVSGARLELDSAMRFEAETHYQAEQQASQAGEQWVSEDPKARKYCVVAILDV